MNRVKDLGDILSRIRYQLHPWPCTHSACHCGLHQSRGGSKCIKCLHDELVELLTDQGQDRQEASDEAHDYIDLVRDLGIRGRKFHTIAEGYDG